MKCMNVHEFYNDVCFYSRFILFVCRKLKLDDKKNLKNLKLISKTGYIDILYRGFYDELGVD